MLKTELFTAYPQKLWIVYSCYQDVHRYVDKKDQINIDFSEFFDIMISDAFINEKGGVST